jgi:hypothetical protein
LSFSKNKIWKFQALILSSAPEPAAATKATAAESSAAEAIAAAALKVLEALALLPATLPILRLSLHVLHFGGRTSAGPIVAIAAGTVVAGRR